MTDEYLEYKWICIKRKFHFTNSTTKKTLCGRNTDALPRYNVLGEKVTESGFELPDFYLMPRINDICKRCDDLLFKMAFQIKRKRR